MGKNVKQAFRAEAERCLRFLVDEFGAAEPVFSTDLVQHLRYVGQDFIYGISYDDRDRDIGVSVERPSTAGDRMPAELENILVVLNLARPYQVRWNAQSLKKLRASTESAAVWIRQVHPHVVGPDGEALLDRSHDLVD